MSARARTAVAPVTAPVGVADVRVERRLGRFAGVAALASLVTMVAALGVAARAVSARAHLGNAPGHATWLSDLHAHGGAQTLAVALRCASLLLTVAAGVYLYRVVRARHGAGRPLVLWLGAVAPLLVAAATVAGYVVISDIADAFSAGPHTEARAEDLISSSAGLRVVRFAEFATRLAFGVWVVLISFDAMRVGALTRVVGYWGVAAGVAVAMQFTPGEALLAGWIGSIGVLFLGYWPGGRPETWRTGRAAAPTF